MCDQFQGSGRPPRVQVVDFCRLVSLVRFMFMMGPVCKGGGGVLIWVLLTCGCEGSVDRSGSSVFSVHHRRGRRFDLCPFDVWLRGVGRSVRAICFLPSAGKALYDEHPPGRFSGVHVARRFDLRNVWVRSDHHRFWHDIQLFPDFHLTWRK